MTYEGLQSVWHTGRAAKRIRCRKPNSQAAPRPPGFVVVSSAMRGNTNCPRSSVPPSPTRAKRGVPLRSMGWRRGWDSNPRYACAYSGFRDRHVQPLRHLSGVADFTSAEDQLAETIAFKAPM